MKNLLLFLFSFTLILPNLSAQEVFISSGKQYPQNEVSLISSSSLKTSIDVKILGITLSDNPINSFKSISLEGYTSIANTGDASLPVIVKFIEIPNYKDVKINITSFDYIEHSNVSVIPQQEIPKRGAQQQITFSINNNYYSKKSFQPANIVEVKEIALIRDKRVAVINIHPVTYNPSENKIRIYSNIQFELSYEGSSNINNSEAPVQKTSKAFDAIYKDIILNYDNSVGGNASESPRLLILVHDSLYASAVPLAQWKTQKGYVIDLMKLSELGLGMTPTALQVKNYFVTRYNSPEKPDFILLVGDVTGTAVIPWHTVVADRTDHPYSCLNGTDVFPDVMVGRISVQTRLALDTVVAKLIQYEKNPYVTDPNWFKRAIILHSNDGIDPINGQVMKRVFEEEGGFEHVQMINNSYSQAQITGFLNQTSSWIWFIGHGSETAWADPVWSQSNMVNLTYGLRSPQVISIACSNADLDYSTTANCFAETFINRSKENSASNICASTELCAFYTTDTLGRYMVYGYFREGIHEFGSMMNYGKIKAHQFFNGNGTVIETINQFMVVGDPTQSTYSDVPKQVILTNTVNGNIRTINVKTVSENEAVANALIGISQNNELKVSGYTDSLGNFSFDQTAIAGQLVKLVVTGTNLYPFVSDIMTGITSNGSIPTSFELVQNYPNPFNPSTKIKFAIPQSSFVSLKVYDILGKEVASLVSQNLIAGSYEVDFNAFNLSSGNYFYRITAGDFTSVKKMLLIK